MHKPKFSVEFVGKQWKTAFSWSLFSSNGDRHLPRSSTKKVASFAEISGTGENNKHLGVEERSAMSRAGSGVCTPQSGKNSCK